MKCENALKLLPAYADRALSKEREAAVKEHLADCSNCRKEVSLLSASWDMLGVLEPIPPSADFRARFWERVRREESEPRGENIIARKGWAPVAAWASALAGFLVLWVLGVAGGVRLFKTGGSTATPSDTALARFVSPYPQNSIEKIFLEGQIPPKNHGGNL